MHLPPAETEDDVERVVLRHLALARLEALGYERVWVGVLALVVHERPASRSISMHTIGQGGQNVPHIRHDPRALRDEDALEDVVLVQAVRDERHNGHVPKELLDHAREVRKLVHCVASRG